MESVKTTLSRRSYTQPNKPHPFVSVKARPSVKRTRYYIDNEYIANGYAELFPHSVTVVYNILARRARHETQQCFPGYDSIMKDSGITNRNTVSLSIKILEAYKLIAVSPGTQYKSNDYLLLDCSEWKPVGSIPLESIKLQKKRQKRVSKTSVQQYQKPLDTGIADDTINHLTKSSNEISKETFKEEPEYKSKYSSIYGFFRSFYREEDITNAITALEKVSPEVSGSAVKTQLQGWTREGKITPIKEVTY